MTRSRALMGSALALTMIAATATAAFAGIWVTTNWTETDLSREACLEKAEHAITAAGFTVTQKLAQSRFGGNSDYTVSIRCITEKGVVFFIAAGPNADQTGKYVTALQTNF